MWLGGKLRRKTNFNAFKLARATVIDILECIRVGLNDHMGRMSKCSFTRKDPNVLSTRAMKRSKCSSTKDEP